MVLIYIVSCKCDDLYDIFHRFILLPWIFNNVQEGFMEFFNRNRDQDGQHEHLADVLGQALRYTAVGAGIVAGLAMFLRR